ncbi:transposase [Nonomuraea basaltis]|uniref:transposase n=1 Tax=Nonomuraea basaltis TaxID=2495887 RepID=UPI0014875A86
MNSTASHRKISVSADGRGLVSHAGGLLLLQTLRVTGLDKALSAQLERWRPGRAIHDPAKVSRLIDRLAADPARSLKAIRAARATARERAWHLAGPHAPGADGQPVIVDLDATIVLSHSDKQHAAPTWKKSYGFHPMTAFADHDQGGGGEPLALMLRAGNAGSVRHEVARVEWMHRLEVRLMP